MKNYNRTLLLLVLLFIATKTIAQNGMVGDGFGGRLWYKPTNYSVGSYSAFTVCELNGNKQLLGWGNNGYGELGQDPSSSSGSATPVAIPNMDQVKYYTTGYSMGVLKEDNSGWVWGYNFSNFNYAPTQVITDVKFVDAAINFVTFVKDDGSVWSIGSNIGGNFGNGTTTDNFNIPMQMTGISNAKRLACGIGVLYVLLDDGTVSVSGSQYLGLGSTISSTYMPLLIPNLNNIVDIKATSFGMLALKSNGDVYEIGGINEYQTATKLNEYSNIVAISGMCDGDEYLLLDENKNCYSNYSGNTILATDVIDILAGETFSYIVKSDGSLWGRGFSNGASIWLNLSDEYREDYTYIDVTQVPELCLVEVNKLIKPSCNSLEVYMVDGAPPYQYDIGTGKQSSSVFTNLAPGTYTVTITDNLGTVTTLQGSVVDVSASFDQSNLSPYVFPENFIRFKSTSTNATSYEWYACDALISTSDSLDFIFPNSGTCCIKLIAKNQGCSDSSEYCFTVITNDTIVQTSCNSIEVIMVSGSAPYQYNIGNGNQSSSVFTGLAPGNYTVTVIDFFGTITTLQITLDDLNASFDPSNPSQDILAGTSIQFTNTSTNATTYKWFACDSLISTNQNTEFTFPNEGICCIKLIASSQWCIDISEYCYNVLENKIIQRPCNSVEVIMQLGSPPYQYDIGNGKQSSNVFPNLEPGNYTVTVTDNIGVITTLSITVQDDSTTLNASFDPSNLSQNIVPGTNIEFINTSSNASAYGWYACDTLISTNQDFDFTFLYEGICCIKLITNNQWCIDSTDYCFSSYIEPSIYFPNIFTPNQDDKNDVFTLNPIKITRFHAVIYNRWGNVMTELDNIHPTWDGMVDGLEASEGVYYYTVDYLIRGEQKKYQGYFQLQR